MLTKYKLTYNGEDFIYDNFWQLRNKLIELLPNVSLPATEEALLNSDTVRYINDAFGIVLKTYEIIEPVPSLTSVKEQKTAEIQGKSNSLIAQTKAGYTDGEVASFEQQYQGATDLLNGNATSTNAIFVLGLLAGRLGHTPSAEEITAFSEKIRNNYFRAASATANILGKQQNLEIRVKNATTIADVEAINWD